MKWSTCLAFAGAAMLTACGAVARIPEAQSAAHAPATPLSSPTLSPGAYVGRPSAMPAPRPHVDLSHPGYGTFATCGDYPQNYQPPTIAQDIADPSRAVRVAALVTIDSVKAPIYNTPDGQRWTQAWYDAGHDLDIYTPYVVTVNRVLSGGGVTAGQRLTVYDEGGRMPNGDMVRTSCEAQPTLGDPQPGVQAVMGLSGPIPGLSTGPTVTLFDVVRDGQVVVAYGSPQPIP